MNGLGNHADGSPVCRDTQSDQNNLKTAESVSQNVRTTQARPKRQNSLVGLETKLAKRPEGRKHISIDENDIYAPQNMPVEGLGMQNQKVRASCVVAVVDAGDRGGLSAMAVIVDAVEDSAEWRCWAGCHRRLC